MARGPERYRTRAFESLEGFHIYTRTMGVSAPSLHKESTDSLIVKKAFEQALSVQM